jgi:hypothetical protein
MRSSQSTRTSPGDYVLGGVWSGALEKKPAAHLPVVVR